MYHFATERGREVIALWIVASVVIGTLIGWYGHKASLRIRVWGLNMNERDRIFQYVSGEEPDITDVPRKLSPVGGRGASASPMSPHLPLGTAGLK
jgi:hypothetical protein